MAPKNKGGDSKGGKGKGKGKEAESSDGGKGKGLKAANSINVRHILVRREYTRFTPVNPLARRRDIYPRQEPIYIFRHAEG